MTPELGSIWECAGGSGLVVDIHDKPGHLRVVVQTDPDGRQSSYELSRFLQLYKITKPRPLEDTSGVKFDQDKPRWDLLPWTAVEAVVRVLGLGAVKYAPDNWRKVPEHRTRYFSACMRHLVAWQEGEQLDPETGENHLAHAACCVLFLLARDTPPE